MARQFFKDLPDTSTPLTASRLNGLLDGEEVLGNLVVDSIKTKNIFVGIIEQGSFLPDSGVPVSSTTRIRSASFTNVKAGNKTISLYNNNNFDVVVYVYDIDGTWKSSESITDWQSLPYTINIQGERKIKIAIRNKNNSTIVPSDVQNVQIEEGDTATTYSPYQNLNGEENYTTEGMIIGKWINGKPLYRKVITTTLPNGSSDILIDTDIQAVWLEIGYFNSPSGNTNRYFTIPFINDSAKRVLGWGLSTGYFHLVNEISTYNGANCYLSLLYTKTTD